MAYESRRGLPPADTGLPELSYKLPDGAAAKTRKPWTPSEDSMLKRLVAQWGDQCGPNSNWERIASHLENRTPKTCRKRWFHSLDPKLKRGRWTEQEDRILREAFKGMGPSWQRIARLIPGRTDDQCAKRYNDVLDPRISDRLRSWTSDEDSQLRLLITKYGTSWSQIAQHMQGRTGLTCRNRWRKLTAVTAQRACPNGDSRANSMREHSHNLSPLKPVVCQEYASQTDIGRCGKPAVSDGPLSVLNSKFTSADGEVNQIEKNVSEPHARFYQYAWPRSARPSAILSPEPSSVACSVSGPQQNGLDYHITSTSPTTACTPSSTFISTASNASTCMSDASPGSQSVHCYKPPLSQSPELTFLDFAPYLNAPLQSEQQPAFFKAHENCPKMTHENKSDITTNGARAAAWTFFSATIKQSGELYVKSRDVQELLSQAAQSQVPIYLNQHNYILNTSRIGLSSDSTSAMSEQARSSAARQFQELENLDSCENLFSVPTGPLDPSNTELSPDHFDYNWLDTMPFNPS